MPLQKWIFQSIDKEPLRVGLFSLAMLSGYKSCLFPSHLPCQVSGKFSILFSFKMLTRAELLHKFFSCFESENIAYAVLGNCRRFLEYSSGDIDIVIHPRDIPRAFNEIRMFCQSNNIRLIQIIKHEQSSWYLVLAWENEKGHLCFIHPDICGDYFRFGKQFLSADDLLMSRGKYLDQFGSEEFFYVPSPAMSFIYYLLKKVSKGEDLSNGQAKFLSEEWNKDPLGAMAQCQQYWPTSISTLIATCASTNDWGKFRHCLPTIQKTLKKSFPFNVSHFLKEIYRKVYRIIYPTGLHIVLLGPDGSGKSTIASQLQEKFLPAFRGTYTWHLWPYRGNSNSKGAIEVMPHTKPSRNLLTSVFKLGYWWINFTVGYLGNVWPSLLGSKLVIFDRYFHDLLIDPKRYRYGGPMWLAQVVKNFIPGPDLLFVLDAPVEVLHTRKNEVAAAEVRRQRAAYQHLARTRTNCFLIDASLPIEKVLCQIQGIMLDYLEKRHHQPRNFPLKWKNTPKHSLESSSIYRSP